MATAKTVGGMSPERMRVAERAKRDPEGRITALARLLDVPALTEAFGRIRKDAAVGVDGVTKQAYGQDLERNLRDLHERMRSGRYRHQPIRRANIPKENGKTRPIGISTIEDKVVQDALRDVLEMLYEPVFLDCSYGFRPGRSAHDALRAVNRMLYQREATWVIEADIVSFFDSIDRKMLMEMLRHRVADESFMRLVGKCLHVGVLDGSEYSVPDVGTVQGSTLSPLLGNVYLHHVLDLWLDQEVRPHLRGRMQVVRYADDFVIGFEREDDARRVMAVLGKRFERYGLKLHPDKTRLFQFKRPEGWDSEAKEVTPFDFLGFTVLCRRSHKGGWAMSFITRRARQRKAIGSLAEWCRSHRHLPVKEQHATLWRKLSGHLNYFAVSGNQRRVEALLHHARRIWFKWLRRRSQRARRMTWERYADMLQTYPLPTPTVRASLWA